MGDKIDMLATRYEEHFGCSPPRLRHSRFMETRLKKMPSWLRNVLIGCAAAIYVTGMILFVHHNMTQEKTAAVKVATAAPVEGPSTCDGIKAAPKDFAVSDGAPLHERADAQSAQVSMAFGVDKDVRPVAIDTTMPVRELCRSGQWSYVNILQLPSDIGNAKGWVPTRNLRPVNTDENGRRIYGLSDFEWPNGSLRHQKAILTVVNRIMSQNRKCDAFNSQSLLIDKDRAGPLIKIACFGAEEQVIDFRPEDATNGRSFAPVEAIDESTARTSCEAAAKERAVHPSTIDISTFDGEFHAYSGGSATYQTTFTAKNAFNLTLKYVIRCSFEETTFSNVEITEAS